MNASLTPILQIRNLKTYFQTEAGIAKAVDGVDFDVFPGEVVGLVGESGSGKSVTALSILRLIPSPPGKIADGSILFQGRNLLELSWPEIRAIRGKEISMIFQEPMTSLNPVFTIGMQMTESVLAHEHVSRKAAFDRSVEMLELVGIPDPPSRMNDYPHQFSGGMRQRVMIAMALSCNPSVLIADEPTTALDVTIQAQLLDLLERECRQRGMSLILITHDLGVVASVTDRILVMYAGRVIESGTTRAVFADPRHPYTAGLLASTPRLETSLRSRLNAIPGAPPTGYTEIAGCPFAPRCGHVMDRCRAEEPELESVTHGPPSHRAACFADLAAATGSPA